MLSQGNRKMGRGRRGRGSHPFAAEIEPLEQRQLLSATPSPTALNPYDIRTYYGFSNIQFTYTKVIETRFGPVVHTFTTPGDGTGETIAIVVADADPNIASDLAAFDKEYNLPPANLTVDSQFTTATDPTGNEEFEESLDVEWAHAMAPGANIVVVNRVDSIKGLLNAVSAAANYPGVSVVSTSTGATEFSGELADESYFANPTNHGGINVSFVTASGDDKSTEGPGPLFPSVLPNVLSVGGTVLTLSPIGGSEQSWDDSEGGPSEYIAEPRYQEFAQQTGDRTTPDVSFAATNYAVYDTFPVLSSKTNQLETLDWATGDGTSFGAPEWAGLLAIANQGRSLIGEPTLSDVPSVMYALPSSDFNDITTGPANREGYSPGPGYDEITGLGSPKAYLIAQALLHPPLVLFPPFDAAAAGNTTGSSSTPQIARDAASSLVSPINADALSDPSGANTASAAPVAASEGNEADAPTSGSTVTAQSPSASGRPSLPLEDAAANTTPGGGSWGGHSDSSLNAESVQWSGLNAALDMLST
jgi:subtilase family serine protease